MKISKEAKIGALAIITFAMVYFGFNYLKGADIFSRTNQYYAVFNNVGSLQAANTIKLSGVQVGRVKSIQLLQQLGNKVLVTLDIDKKVELRQGSKALLTSELLGGSSITLYVSTTGKKLQEGDTLVADTEKGIQALLQETALPVVQDADSLILHLTKVVKQFDNTGYVLNRLLTSADQTTQGLNATIDQNKAALAATIANVNTLSASLIETEKSFKPILANLKTSTDSLKALRIGQTLAEANVAVKSLQRTLLEVERGNGSLGKMLKDQTLYDNMNRTVVSVNKLMTNLRQYPKRYVNISVFGKKDKGPADSPADTTMEY